MRVLFPLVKTGISPTATTVSGVFATKGKIALCAGGYNKPEVVAYGSLFLRYMCPCYVLICVNQVYSGSLRGAGISQPPTYIMLASFVVFRQIYLYIMANFVSNTILPIAMGYPAGWLVCSVLTLIYYSHVDLAGKRVVDDPTSMPEKV